MKTMEPHTVVGNVDKPRDVGGNDPQSRRARIAAKARANPKEKFTSLLHHLSPQLIQENLKKIPLKSAPGTDGMTVEQARSNLDWILPPLMQQIHAGQYTAPPVRRGYISRSRMVVSAQLECRRLSIAPYKERQRRF